MDDSTERVGPFARVRARTSVDHALRAIQQKFTQLSIAADHKASIVIGSTLVMLGFLVDTVHSGRASVAVYVMGGFALLSCLFALLGVLPRVTHRGRSQCGPARLTNPLFLMISTRLALRTISGTWLTSWPTTRISIGPLLWTFTSRGACSDASTVTCATAT